MAFINRKNELQELERRFNSVKSELFVIYGKRRVGKTELVKQFLTGKHAVYFLADKRTTVDQLRELAQLVAHKFNDPFLEQQGFRDWLQVFQYLKRAIKHRFVFVIDEFPYLTEVDSATSSLFQKGWDEYFRDANIMLILLGSSISLMESEILIQKAPLFGRRTGQLLLQPLLFQEAWQFFPKKSFSDFLNIYAVTGGMPAYLTQIDEHVSIGKNFLLHILPKTEFLHNEVEFVLKEELREPKIYLSLLRAISFGKRKLSEIVNDTGIESAVATKYLHTLANLHIIEREIPITEKHPEKSRKGLYRINDNFFRFWFQYIFPHKSDLEMSRYDEVLRKFNEQFPLLVSWVYEEISREFLLSWAAQIFSFERVGRWWDKNEEIDLVALNQQTQQILFGECKWSEKPIGTNIYEALKKKAKLVEWEVDARKEYYILFSKKGFTKDMLQVAKSEKVFLVKENQLLV